MSQFFSVFKQRGLALFQILLIAAMLSLMLFTLQQQANKQVKLALLVQQRAEALLQAETVFSQLELAILTQNSRSFVGWNLHNQPFNHAGFSVQIQDFSGLYSIGSFGNSHLLNLIVQQGYSEDQARGIIAALDHWQKPAGPGTISDRSRQAPLQSLVELQQIPGITPDLYQQLAPYLTLYQRPFFNPMSAPDRILKSILTAEIAEQVIQLRQHNQLTANSFWRLTGIDATDTISYSNGPGYRIRLNYQDPQLAFTRINEVTLRATAKPPISYWQRKRLSIITDGE